MTLQASFVTGQECTRPLHPDPLSSPNPNRLGHLPKAEWSVASGTKDFS